MMTTLTAPMFVIDDDAIIITSVSVAPAGAALARRRFVLSSLLMGTAVAFCFVLIGGGAPPRFRRAMVPIFGVARHPQLLSGAWIYSQYLISLLRAIDLLWLLLLLPLLFLCDDYYAKMLMSPVKDGLLLRAAAAALPIRHRREPKSLFSCPFLLQGPLLTK